MCIHGWCNAGDVMCVHMHEAHPLFKEELLLRQSKTVVLRSKRPGVLHMCTLAGAIEKPSHNYNNNLSILNNICIQAYYILSQIRGYL